MSVELERLLVGIKNFIPYSTLRQTLKITEYRDKMLMGMVEQLTAYVLAEEVEKRDRVVEFEYEAPVNWWEHFKADVVPSIFYHFTGKPKYRTMVLKKMVRFRRLATYPKAQIEIPELGDTIIYRTQIKEIE